VVLKIDLSARAAGLADYDWTLALRIGTWPVGFATVHSITSNLANFSTRNIASRKSLWNVTSRILCLCFILSQSYFCVGRVLRFLMILPSPLQKHINV